VQKSGSGGLSAGIGQLLTKSTSSGSKGSGNSLENAAATVTTGVVGPPTLQRTTSSLIPQQFAALALRRIEEV
jgi:hypothetical protein